jgi:hypothetical protein
MCWWIDIVAWFGVLLHFDTISEFVTNNQSISGTVNGTNINSNCDTIHSQAHIPAINATI